MRAARGIYAPYYNCNENSGPMRWSKPGALVAPARLCLSLSCVSVVAVCLAAKWWEEWVARPSLDIFSVPLICLSYLPMAGSPGIGPGRERFGVSAATIAVEPVKTFPTARAPVLYREACVLLRAFSAYTGMEKMVVPLRFALRRRANQARTLLLRHGTIKWIDCARVSVCAFFPDFSSLKWWSLLESRQLPLLALG